MKTRIERNNPDQVTPPTPASETGARDAKKKTRATRRPREIVAFLFLATCLTSLAAWGKGFVSLKDGSYSSFFIDLDESKTAPGLKLYRFYNSRTLNIGIFGSGWCSPFESRLRIASDKSQVILSDCGREGEIRFTKIDPERNEYFHPDSHWVSLITEKQHYILTSKDGNIRRFDVKGRLLVWENSKDTHLSFFYDRSGRLTEVKTKSGATLQLYYQASATGRRQLVTRVQSSGGRSAEYKYEAATRNLIHTKNSWGSLFRYRYDSLGNLVQTLFPDGTEETLSYQRDQDWVEAFKGRDGCLEKYRFLPKSPPALGHVSTAEKSCQGQKKSKVKMDFVFHRNSKNEKYLSTIKIEKDGQVLPEVKLDESGSVNHYTQSQSSEDEVVIAVIDTGADLKHPDLLPHLWKNSGETGLDHLRRDKSSNGIDDDRNGFIDDVHGWDFSDGFSGSKNLSDSNGHGTHISGIIAQILSVRPSERPIKIMILKYYDSRKPYVNSIATTVSAIRYATQMGAKIINYSAGGLKPNPAEREAIREAKEKGVIFIAAAGNEHSNIDSTGFYPASYSTTSSLDNIIAVSAHDSDLRLLPSSNYGVRSVTLAAPGQRILSSLPGGKRGAMTGTSQATAFVSAAAALFVAKYTNLSDAKTVQETLAKTGNRAPALADVTQEGSALNIEKSLTIRGHGLTVSDLIAVNTPSHHPSRYAAPFSTDSSELLPPMSSLP